MSLQSALAESFQKALANLSDAKTLDGVSQADKSVQALWEETARLVRRYQHVAQQVIECILPDLQLAAEEHEPELANCLLETVGNWVDGLKQGVDEVFGKYARVALVVRDLRL